MNHTISVSLRSNRSPLTLEENTIPHYEEITFPSHFTKTTETMMIIITLNFFSLSKAYLQFISFFMWTDGYVPCSLSSVLSTLNRRTDYKNRLSYFFKRTLLHFAYRLETMFSNCNPRKYNPNTHY